MAAYQFDVRYSESQLRSAVRTLYRYILRQQIDWKLFVALGLIVLALWLHGTRPGLQWYEWMLAGVAAFACAFLILLYRAHLRQSLERLRAMKEPVARFCVTEDSLTVTSDLGSSTMPWTTFTAALDAPGSLLLVVGRTAMITVPTAGVDAAALEFIRAKVNRPQGAV